MSLDRDWQVRLAALEAIGRLRRAGGGVVTSQELDDGFLFDGERIPLWNARRGIWRPRILRDPGAVLTVVTAPRVKGREPAYDDEVASDSNGWFGYKYEGRDPNEWTNVAVRKAMELQRPIIYLYGVTPGIYEVLAPTYVTGDNPGSLTFSLQTDVGADVIDIETRNVAIGAGRREYQTVAAKRRIHQHRFRELVLSAYVRRCAICRLGHEKLLDAAHIIPDHDDRGFPLVSNGLSLCKIHHSAYDANIIGISPDLLVRVRHDILEEIDGPMLEHGLKKMDGSMIRTPRRAELRPNPDFLAVRFDQFRAA